MKAKAPVIMLLSDIHVGSTVGLWPENFISNEGNPIGQNKFQKWLWQCWMDMAEWSRQVVRDATFELVINGDMVEGIHHRTLQVMTPDVGDQSAAVMAIMDTLPKPERWHIIKGTECHTRGDEIRIGKHLGSSRDPVTGQHAWDSLDLEVNGCLYNFAHHIGATSRSYLEASLHSITLGNVSHSRARTKKRVPDVICRAHRHRHGEWTDGNQMSVTTGGWQGLTRHGYKFVPDAVPQPSCIVFDHRGVERGELPIIHRRIYTAQ